MDKQLNYATILVMEKKNIELFIDKYNLNDAIKQVNLVSDSKQKTLSVKASAEDRNLLAFVTMKNWEGSDTAEFPVADTKKLKSMLSPLSEKVVVQAVSDGTKFVSIVFSDDYVECDYALADASVVGKTPWLKKEPVDYDVEIDLNEDFRDRFLKATSALSESDTFSLVLNKSKKIDIVLGFSNNNTNKIKLSANVLPGKDNLDKSLHFNAAYLKSILNANKDVDNMVLKVLNQGLAKIEFDKTDFSAKYFLIAITDDN